MLFWSEPLARFIVPRYPNPSCTLSSAESVTVATSDDLLDGTGVRAVEFMRLDIEGAELDALQSAVRALDRALSRTDSTVAHRRPATSLVSTPSAAIKNAIACIALRYGNDDIHT